MFKVRPRSNVESNEEQVEVHVTKNGGFYVDADKLMRSSKARKAIDDMQEIFEMEAGRTSSSSPGSTSSGGKTVSQDGFQANFGCARPPAVVENEEEA